MEVRIISVLAERINSLMDENGMKINGVEKAIGKGNGTVRKMLADDSPNSKLDLLVALADLFNTTVSYLIGETDDRARGKLVLENEKHDWDYLLPLTKDECQWIAVKRFVESRSEKPLDEFETERRVNQHLDEQA